MKDYLFPSLDEKVEQIVDEESVNNIYHISLVIGLFEALTLPVFFCTTGNIDYEDRVSIVCVLFCILICFTGRALAGIILKKKPVSHELVTVFKVIYCLVLSAWAIWVSHRHYFRGDQLVTFFAVELMIVCFITLRPWISIILTLAVYVDLYVILYAIDGAAGINPLNYLVLVFASVIGMIIRFHAQTRLAEMTVSQQYHSTLLEHANRHDGLTGLRNRKALEEDMAVFFGKPVTAYMIDVNYFKEINDTHGHLVGDEVLRETAQQLKRHFPGERCYRYGGDEFLVLHTGESAAMEADHETFTIPAIPNEKIILSIGRAQGVPENHNALFDLIGEADVNLYEAKRKTHSPEFGGHERRRRSPRKQLKGL